MGDVDPWLRWHWLLGFPPEAERAGISVGLINLRCIRLRKAAFGRPFIRLQSEPPDGSTRKTLAEYTRIYLRSLECPAIAAESRRGKDDRDHFAAQVAEGMKRAQLVLVPRDSGIA
jgi:hypothetical protein